MFFSAKSKAGQSAKDPILEIVNRTHAVISFKPDGTVITANDHFLTVMGYTLQDIIGNHHAIFVDPDFVKTKDYETFWTKLANGETFTDQFPRVSQSGKVIWMQATYGPAFDEDGNVIKVIKIATDVSQRRAAVDDIATALGALNSGDLTHDISHFGIPDLDDIGSAFNHAMAQLRDTMHNIASITDQIQSIGCEVGDTSSNLSTRTASQAATLEQTAAAIEELTATVRSSSEGVRSAEKLAIDATSAAQNGGTVVEQSICAMAKIEESSKAISKIISVIDDIAFQTNLLALNAGVEAARAGDAGRGFAVVASEVRGLAHRSQEAAGEIKQLISQSTQHVSQGVDLVNNTGTELKKIIESITTISGTMANVSQGASEQSTALNEINNGVGHLDSVTQQNASMVDQVAAINQSLLMTMQQLTDQVAHFEIGRGHAQPLQRHYAS